MEKQEFEIHSYQKPNASGSYYKVFYTDGSYEIFSPYTYPKFAAMIDHRCNSYAELRRSYPRTRYIITKGSGFVYDKAKSKSEIKKQIKEYEITDGNPYNFDIKAIDTGKAVDLSDEERKEFYPQRKQKAKEIKLKQPKMTNAKLGRMSRGV